MDNLPALTRKDRLLMLAPHPDDEALATGGLLQRATEAQAVRVIFLTDGDNNPWPQRVIERRWRVADADARARWGALRRHEALASLLVLGHGPNEAEFWALPDQGLTNLLLTGGEQFVDRLCKAIDAWQPTCIAAPSLRDRHPDHSALGVAMHVALRRFIGSCQAPHPALLSYIVHGDPRPAHAPIFGLVLDTGETEAKRSAILCHRSQTLLSRRRFLAHAQPEESFMTNSAWNEPDDSHPIRHVHWDEAGLSVSFKANRVSRTFGKPKVHILTETAVGSLRYICPPVCTFNVSGVLRLSPTFFDPGTQRVFIKLETRCGVYDAAGWKYYEVGNEIQALPQLTVPTVRKLSDGAPQALDVQSRLLVEQV